MQVAKARLRAPTPPPKPNFVFILVDDLGRNDLGFNGSKFYETPNIDKLAAQGCGSQNAYAPHPPPVLHREPAS